ncbi:MAG TPA: ABC transporter permease, partial [Deinococcales bacterium]|nr:ABC transporter permease [Deinococcales bacterium]
QVPGALPEELSEVRRRAGDLLDRPAVSVKVVEAETQRSGEGVVASGSNQTTPGMTLMFALLFGAQTGLGLHRARAAGTIARLFAAPVPPIALLLGTVLGNALLLALQLTVMIAFGGLVLGVRWGNLLVIAFPAFAFAVMAASFGAFNAAVTRSQAQLTSFSFLVVAVTSALGGLWWPLEVTPVWMQRAASALPTYWGMQAFQTVMLRGGSILDVLLPVAVLLGFAAAFLAVGSRAFTYD